MTNLAEYYTISDIINQAESFIDDVDIITFDVFDTVLIRRIENPDLVKIPVSRFIEQKAKSLKLEAYYLNLLHHRSRVESKWRDINGAKGPDHEANYDVFMPEFLSEVFGDKLPHDFFDEVAAYEMKIEDSVLVVRQEFLQWIESLHKRGKRLFLLSDIYLPAKYLKQLAKMKGIDHYFEDIISSADTLQAKASGAAFPLIQEKYQLDKSKWLHLGDNPFSDGLQPLEYGIKSLVLKDYKEKHRKKISRKYNLLSGEFHLWKGRNLMQAMMPLESENKALPKLFIDGHNFFGYLFGYFLQALAEKCKSRKIKKIYFCAREGWLLQKCWNEVVHHYYPQGEAPQTEYLYVSRIALAKAMCANTGLSYQVISVIFLPPNNKTFTDLCRVFDLDINDYVVFLEKYHLTPTTVISPHDNKDKTIQRNVEELIHDNEFQAFVKSQTQIHCDLFNDYLNQINFFDDEDIAFVDIGWLGTIQTFFNNAITHQNKKPNIHGFMLAATRGMEYPQTPNNYFEGLVYDAHKMNLSASVLEYIRDIFEEITRSPDATLRGFAREDDGMVIPVLRRTDDAVGINEATQTKHYEPAQHGIVAGVKSYARAQELFGYDTIELRPWLNLLLLQRIAYPNHNEVERLKILEHVDDFGGKNPAGNNKLEGVSSVWALSKAKLRLNPFAKLFYHRKHVKLKCKNS